MKRIESMQDLAEARKEALQRQRAGKRSHQTLIRIGMGSCGIAVGARETLDALYQQLAGEHILGADMAGVRVTQTGCIGLCALEPIVQVHMPGQPLVTYGRVTPEVARRIVQQHICGGLVVDEFVVENV